MKASDYLVLSIPDSEQYLQVILAGGLCLECSGSAAGDAPTLSGDQQRMLVDLGWERPDARAYPNFRVVWSGEAETSNRLPIEDFRQAAALITETLRMVHGVFDPDQIHLESGNTTELRELEEQTDADESGVTTDQMIRRGDLSPNLKRVLIDALVWHDKHSALQSSRTKRTATEPKRKWWEQALDLSSSILDEFAQPNVNIDHELARLRSPRAYHPDPQEVVELRKVIDLYLESGEVPDRQLQEVTLLRRFLGIL